MANASFQTIAVLIQILITTFCFTRNSNATVTVSKRYNACQNPHLTVELETTSLDCGASVPISATEAQPTVSFSNGQSDTFYLLVMVDLDAPFAARADPDEYWAHWIVANVQGAPGQLDIQGGDTILEFNPPSPPPGTGLHRYQLFLFAQPSLLSGSALTPPSNRGGFRLSAYVNAIPEGSWQNPAAAFQFSTQN